MPKIKCSRCGETKEAYLENPYAGSALGQKIGQMVCEGCFSEWQTVQTMLINEYRLTPAFKEHRQILITKMKEFFNMKD